MKDEGSGGRAALLAVIGTLLLPGVTRIKPE